MGTLQIWLVERWLPQCTTLGEHWRIVSQASMESASPSLNVALIWKRGEPLGLVMAPSTPNSDTSE